MENLIKYYEHKIILYVAYTHLVIIIHNLIKIKNIDHVQVIGDNSHGGVVH